LATGPSVWARSDFENDEPSIFHFSDSDLVELEQATTNLHARGIPPLEFRKEDFPLPNLGPKLIELLDEVEYGRGFVFRRFNSQVHKLRAI
jgi:hypothetical protein